MRQTRSARELLRPASLSVVFQDYTSSANPRFRVEHIIGESLAGLERSTGQRVNRRARIYELLEQSEPARPRSSPLSA